MGSNWRKVRVQRRMARGLPGQSTGNLWVAEWEAAQNDIRAMFRSGDRHETLTPCSNRMAFGVVQAVARHTASSRVTDRDRAPVILLRFSQKFHLPTKWLAVDSDKNRQKKAPNHNMKKRITSLAIITLAGLNLARPNQTTRALEPRRSISGRDQHWLQRSARRHSQR